MEDAPFPFWRRVSCGFWRERSGITTNRPTNPMKAGLFFSIASWAFAIGADRARREWSSRALLLLRYSLAVG